MLIAGITLLFHLPLLLAATRLTRVYLAPSQPLLGGIDTFFVFCILWRLETLLLHSVGLVAWWPTLITHLIVWGIVLTMTQRPARKSLTLSQLGTREAATMAGWVGIVALVTLLRIWQWPDPYDSLTYHLMLPVHWLQQQALAPLATPFGGIAPTYTPASVEGFFLALMLPTGSDFLARIGQLPFLLLGGWLIADLIRRQQPRQLWLAACGATVYLLLPDLLLQGTGSMADTAAATFALAALHALIRWRQQSSRALLAYSGALVGLYLASRFPSLVFLPCLLIAFLPQLRTRWSNWLQFGIPLLITGAFPYLRNWIMTGNPVYPLQVTWGESEILPGLYTSEATRKASYSLGFTAMLQYCWYYFLASGSVWLGLGMLAPIGDRRRTTLTWWAVAVSMLLVQFFVIPYNANGRFLFVPWGLLIVCACVTWGRWKLGRGMLLLAAATWCGQALWELPKLPQLTVFADGRATLVVCAVIGAFALGASFGWLLRSLSAQPRNLALVLTGVLSLATFDGVQRLRDQDSALWSRDHAQRYTEFQEGWLWVQELEEPATIAYAGANLPYPLAGPEGQHRVVTVPLDGSPSGLLPHEYRERLGSRYEVARDTNEVTVDRLYPDRTAWLRTLRSEGIDFLALYVGGRHPVPEYDWARRDPSNFERVTSERRRGLVIYRVLPSPR